MLKPDDACTLCMAMAKKNTKKSDLTALGFFYVASDDLHAEAISRSVDDKGDFSDGVLASRVTVAKVDLVLVFVVGEENESVRYAALATLHARGGGTGKQGVRLSDLVPIDVPLVALRNNLVPAVREEMDQLLAWDAERPPPASWDSIWSAIKQLVNADQRAGLEELERRRRSPAFNFSDPSTDSIYCQKDAVSVALDIAGINRNPVFANLSDGLAKGKPLLASLTGSLKEHVVVRHDAAQVPGFLKQYDGGNHCTFQQGSRVLTVYDVDFEPGEIALGCDLIYFNHYFGSFTFVQYKLMDDEGGIPVYRPDKQCNEEVVRMKNFLSYLDNKPRDRAKIEHFRLVGNPFFLKLCRRERLLIDLPQLTKGMYLNLDFWDQLSKDPRVAGPKGGTRISFGAADRWLCRTEFAPLVGEGWTGTYGLSEEELAMWVDAAAADHRRLIYAKSSGQRKTRRA